MTISLIVAHDKNRLIGNNGRLPWYLPNDLKYFKEKTMGNIVIMGRVTYESIGKPLPNRINVIMSKNTKFKNDKCLVFNSTEQLLNSICVEEEVFVIGGSGIYNEFLPYAHKLYVTEINSEFEGDTYFPKYEDEFKLVSEIPGIVDENNHYEHVFKEFDFKR